MSSEPSRSDHPDDTAHDGPKARPARRLEIIRADQVSADTAQTPGMDRFAAISASTVGSQAVWMGLTRLAPGARSGDHHHGDSETAIYVLAGHPEFVTVARGAQTRLATSPGDFVFVPPNVAHREENPSPDTEAVVVIARSTQEAIVVNLEDLFGPTT